MKSNLMKGSNLSSLATSNPLDSARRKVYLRSLPLLFVCYIIAYIDRNNVSIASLTMSNSLPAFTKAVIGTGAGIFFLGYFLLEIPGTLIVERWSASKWICRIMVTWGIIAAMTAFVKEPYHFYTIRFLLGLAEAGFFPGVIVYLTHWFPIKDRARAISIFLIASPIAMIVGNWTSQLMLNIGEDGAPTFFGLRGWQCIFLFWGIPAVIMGIVVVLALTDRPKHAKWLSEDERDALEAELAREKAQHQSSGHMSVMQGLTNPNVLMLCLAYFGVVTGNYGIEIFLPSILEDWYGLGNVTVAYLAMIPSLLVIVGQLGNGWSSDHFHERRWHAILPIIFGALGLIFATLTQGNLVLTMICFTIAATGMKAYMPAFWSLPNMYLTAAAAAGSIGLINSVGNLGGYLGPTVVGNVKTLTGSYDFGLYFLSATCLISASVIFFMPMVHKRLSDANNKSSKIQVLGVVGTVFAVLFTFSYLWVQNQIKPWGLSKPEVLQLKSGTPEFGKSLADSLDDWFAKKPQIRDAVLFRLDSLTSGLKSTKEKHSDESSLKALVDEQLLKIDELKKEVQLKKADEKTKEKKYALTVIQAREKADELVKSLQDELRKLQ